MAGKVGKRALESWKGRKGALEVWNDDIVSRKGLEGRGRSYGRLERRERVVEVWNR